MDNQCIEKIKEELKLSLAGNVYFSYRYPNKIIRRQGQDYCGPYVVTATFIFSLIVESDYDCIELDKDDIKLNYATDHGGYLCKSYLYDYKLCDESYRTEMRSYLRKQARPLIDFLLETGFKSETDIEDFMLLKNTTLHFTKISQEEKEKELKKKAE